MRKKILLIIALCGFYGVGAAQQSDDTTDRIRFGVKGGASFSNMKYSNLDQYDKSGVIGGVGGVFAEFDLGYYRRFSIRPELMFTRRGSEVNGVYNGTPFNYQLTAKYTDVRIPVIFNFNDPDKINPYIYVAPVFGFARGGDINYSEGSGTDVNAYPLMDLSDANFSKFNFSAAAGVGVRFPVRLTDSKRLYLALEANYQYGFTDTYGDKEKNGEAIAVNRRAYDITGTRKNRGFEVTASVSIPLSIFKKSKKAPQQQEYVYTQAPVVAPEPAPVVQEKPCYTLDEILQLIAENKSIKGKTICAIDIINFEFDKSTLTQKSRDYLDKIAILFKQNGCRVEIKGHTDSTGSADYNMKLSKRRAKAVYEYLIQKGVSPQKLSYSYYGMTKPIATNQTSEGRRMNRRVEFDIID